ncbi:hypothetical protein LZ32DRAFT_606077 [Colletotrichum eremochloae]|nr:hypothetical protein LZ32DRAFT_606077 [Colletotrichum eremochloae]
MSSRRRHLIMEDAILGIDLGSSSTRLCLWCPKRKQEDIDIENTETIGATPRGDFPSVGYPFEPEGPVYLGCDVDPNRRPISLKYAFYALAEADEEDKMLDQYVLVTPLTSQKGNPVFRDRLMRGLRELFLFLKEKVDSSCKKHHLRIDTIGVSIPSQWTLDFERVYREIIVDVFEHSPDKISFHTETEALAHALLRNHRHALPECGDKMYDVYLFLDFGGHNMNGCIFNVVHGQDDDASFYRIGNPFGAGGGSEQWSYHIGKKFANHFRFMKRRPITPEEWKVFIDQFDSCKPRINPNSSNGRLLIGGWGDVTLNSDDIKKYFEQSHGNVLEKARKMIAKVSKINGVTPYVIVSGGTAKHKTVQERLRIMCKDHDIDEPQFTNEWSISHASARIARGVAYAAGSRLTFNQFLQRGAAFGIQRKQMSIQDDGKPAGEWESVAYLLFSKNVQRAVKENTNGRDKFKIICDPFFEPGEDPNLLHFDHCYDFLYLGKLKKGEWKITFSVTGTQDSPSVALKSSHVYNRKSKTHKRRAIKTFDVEHTTNPLPMSFDGGANCYFVDKETFDRDHFCRWVPSRSPEVSREANLNKLYDSENEDHASSPSAVEDQEKNNATIAQQHDTGPASEYPTSQYRLVLQENYQTPTAATVSSIPNARSNELLRNEVDYPRLRSGKWVGNREGLPLLSASRRPVNTARDAGRLPSAPTAAGLKDKPIVGQKRTPDGIADDTESDSSSSSDSDSEDSSIGNFG